MNFQPYLLKTAFLLAGAASRIGSAAAASHGYDTRTSSIY
jgi:hypothetical protein